MTHQERGALIRAIETRYKGYRFRSRLEARWAVFFDAAGIVWEYEPQGFVLPSRRYLPDFYLPTFGAYAEVKPLDEAVDWRAAEELSVGTGRPVVALCGAPDFRWYPSIYAPDFVPVTPEDPERSVWRDWVDLATSVGEGRLWMDTTGTTTVPVWPILRLPRYVDAVHAARGARFEFGECGGVA